MPELNVPSHRVRFLPLSLLFKTCVSIANLACTGQAEPAGTEVIGY